jgi:hypothetical protein
LADLPQEVIPATRAQVNGQPGPLQHPGEMGRYYTLIQFIKYGRKNPKSRALGTAQADIVLPLPNNLREYYAIMYGDVEFDKIGGVMDVADQFVSDFQAGRAKLDADALADAGAATTELAQAVSRRFVNYISGDLGGVIDRVQGNVVNPHITAVFRGVGLREHTLSWTVTARTPQESRNVRRILDFVREKMHPTKKSAFLLNFPDEAYVRFCVDDQEFLYPIYKSVVTSLVIDPSSDGNNAFFKGTDAPVVTNFEITFKEVESLTREDFTGQPTGEGGIETPAQGQNLTDGAFGESDG